MRSAPSADVSHGDSMCGSTVQATGKSASTISATASRSPAIRAIASPRKRTWLSASAGWSAKGAMGPKRLRPGMSRAVKTATMPACAATKAAVSPITNEARWCGERTTSTDSASAGKASAPKLSAPVDLGLAVEPDRRRADGVAAGRHAAIERGGMARGVQHGLDDLAVAGAAAEHAAQRIAHVLFAGRGISFEQRRGRNQEARRADAALRGAMREEGGLQRRQFAVGRVLRRCAPRGPQRRLSEPGRRRPARRRAGRCRRRNRRRRSRSWCRSGRARRAAPTTAAVTGGTLTETAAPLTSKPVVARSRLMPRGPGPTVLSRPIQRPPTARATRSRAPRQAGIRRCRAHRRSASGRRNAARQVRRSRRVCLPRNSSSRPRRRWATAEHAPTAIATSARLPSSPSAIRTAVMAIEITR